MLELPPSASGMIVISLRAPLYPGDPARNRGTRELLRFRRAQHSAEGQDILTHKRDWVPFRIKQIHVHPTP